MLAAPADARRTFLIKALAVLGTCLYVLMVAKSIAGSSGPSGFHLPYFGIGLVLAPLALIATVRMPMLFPFAVFVALLPFDPLLSVTSGATLVRFLGILTAIALLVRILLTRQALRLRAPWYYWFAYVAWAAISMMWTIDMRESKLVFGIFIQNFGMMTILAAYPLTRRDFNVVVAFMVASGVFAVLYALHTTVAPIESSGRISIATGSGAVMDQNFFATSFMLPIAFAFATAVTTRRVLVRLLCWGAVGTMMLGVLVSGSRGGFIALALMFVYFAIRSRSLAQVGLMFAGFVALLVRYPLVWQRFLHDDGGGTGSGRTLIWEVGLQALRGNWLFGSGIGSFPEQYARAFLSAFQRENQGWMRPAHNVLVGMSVELGLVGIVLLLFAAFQTVRSLRVIRRSSPNFVWRMACEGGLLALAVQSMFIDPMWLKFVWLGFTLPFMVLNLERPQAAFGRRAVAYGTAAGIPA